MQEQEFDLGLEREKRERRVVNKTSDAIYMSAAVLFDIDGQTSVIRQPRFDPPNEELCRSTRTTLSHSGKDYLVEVIYIGEQRDAEKAEKDYEKSRRAAEILQARKRRIDEEGGYLDIFPREVEEDTTGGGTEEQVEDSSDGEEAVELIPTKRRKTQPLKKPVTINILDLYTASTSSPEPASELRPYVDFMPNADKKVKDTVEKFLTTGQVEVVTRTRDEAAACCEHCHLTSSIPEIMAILNQQNEILKQHGQVLNQLNQNVEKLLNSQQADLTFINGIFDPAPNGSAQAVGAEGNNRVLPAVQATPPVVSSPSLPNISGSAVPKSVRVGVRKCLVDIGGHKTFVEFEDSSCRIADSTISKVLEMSDNIKSFSSSLALAIYTPDELVGHAVDGSRDGKVPLSPRRKSAIKQASMDAFSVPQSQRDEKWNKDCREAINKKLRSTFSFVKTNEQ